MPDAPRIDDELPLLYELALSVGAALDPSENASAFAGTLAARKELENVAVWMREEDGAPLRPLHATSTSYVNTATLTTDHPLVQQLRTSDKVSTHAADADFSALAAGRSAQSGALVAFRLGEVGLLEMHDSRREAPFPPRELTQLDPALTKLEHVLRGSRAHQRLQEEVQRRIRTERKLRRSRSQLSALIQSIQDAILVENEDGELILANQAFCDLFEIEESPSALTGTDCRAAAEAAQDLFVDPSVLTDRVEEIVEAGEPVTAEPLHMADGRIVERDYVPVDLDDQTTGHLWQYRDVTEQRKAEAKIRRLKDFYEQVLNAMPIDLAIFGPEGRYEYVTPSAVGDPDRREQIIGMTDVEYARMWGHDVDTARARLKTIRRVARTRKTEQFEETLEGPDGDPRYYVRFVTPVVQDGEVVQVLGYGMEITQRKRAEMALREAKEQAEASLAAKERFLATMSHEIRTPLNAVLGMARLLARTDLTEDQRSYLQSIRFSAETLLTLLNTVLDFAKLGSDEVELERTAFNPAHLARHVREMLRSKATEGVTFRVETASALPERVVGDAARVGQILTNLASNALKFTQEGRVVIRVAPGSPPDDQSPKEAPLPGAADTWLTFQVVDTGRGIPPDQQDRIFGDFSQASEGRSGSREGAGL
ncbi:MAG: PAS domain-containing sensor histidine kinase, partial [Salinibacter sp.]|uniref:PAS domain-containing sensor histidine kinase n=1 Tax=Salinibacter sp. TaxID=2065818 RepID=UPI0035D52350